MIRFGLGFIVLSFAVFMSGCFGRLVTVTVVDQNGEPVPEAEVGMGFLGFPGWGDGTELTNANGKVTQWGDDSLGIKTSVYKSGYYRSERRLGTRDRLFLNEKIIMREKLNPISMYVRRVSVRFYKQGVKKCLDMKAGDLVAPRGRGKQAHICFRFWGDKRDNFDKEGVIEIDFPGEKGGMRELDPASTLRYSDFKFPYRAPESGYDNKLRHNIMRRPEEAGYKYSSTLEHQRIGYFFKSVVKPDGESDSEKAFFGKILGEIAFSPLMNDDENAIGFVRFTYYLNPDKGNRNTEYNRDNLFPDDVNSYPVSFPY